jgi:hypothetical protein
MRGVAGAVLDFPGGGIAPGIADDAGAMRISAGEHGCMPGGRDREGMAIVRIGEPCATLEKASQAVGGELVAVVDQLALRKAVDDHENDQPRWRVSGSRRLRGAAGQDQQGKQDDFCSAKHRGPSRALPYSHSMVAGGLDEMS